MSTPGGIVGGPVTMLAGMRCYAIPIEDARLGDFVYLVNPYLDTFEHYEILEIVMGPSMLASCVLIDSDQEAIIGMHRMLNLGTEYYRVYRASARDRRSLERQGMTWNTSLDLENVVGVHRSTVRSIRNRLFTERSPRTWSEQLRRVWRYITDI